MEGLYSKMLHTVKSYLAPHLKNCSHQMKRLKEIGMVLGVIFIYMPLFLSWCAWDWLRNGGRER